jgi:hypothetical protein
MNEWAGQSPESASMAAIGQRLRELGSFCVVERATGRVLAFPSSISPTRIMTEYPQVVDRASQVFG